MPPKIAWNDFAPRKRPGDSLASDDKALKVTPSSPTKQDDDNPPPSFENAGNSCYINAAFQMLMAIVISARIDDLPKSILDFFEGGVHNGHELVAYYNKLLTEDELMKSSQPFNHEASDAYEAYLNMVHVLFRKGCKQLTKITSSEVIHTCLCNRARVFDASKAHEAYRKKTEMWTEMTVRPLGVEATVGDLISREFGGRGFDPEPLDDVFCDVCQDGRGAGLRFVTLGSLANVLVVHIAREGYPSCSVRIPLDFSIELQTRHGHVTTQVLNYKLQAVTIHKDHHYFVFRLYRGRWWCINDDRVKLIPNIESMLRAYSSNISIIVYKKS
jgi:ubiquitin C-terminal hydrolase